MPSLFDILVSGILAVPFLVSPHREIFFIFYIVFLLCVSMMIKPRREVKTVGLSLLCLCSFFGVFIHSFELSTTSITSKYINLYLMSEGFIYILFGSLFLSTAIRYCKNLNHLFFIIPLASYPALKYMIDNHQTSFLFALLITLSVYLMIKNKNRFGGFILGIPIGIAILNYKFLFSKVMCRVEVWGKMIASICQHPFVGVGFNKYLNFDNMAYCSADKGRLGWTYLHNDYLNIGTVLGVPALLAALFFVYEMISLSRKSYMVILLIAIALTSFFQITMFQIDKASIVLILIALAVVRAKNKEAVCVG
jgi:hypothetical protein